MSTYLFSKSLRRIVNELCKLLQRLTYFVLPYYDFYLRERKREQRTGTDASGGVLCETQASFLCDAHLGEHVNAQTGKAALSR